MSVWVRTMSVFLEVPDFCRALVGVVAAGVAGLGRGGEPLPGTVPGAVTPSALLPCLPEGLGRLPYHQGSSEIVG